jgi:hypothetical protein
MRSEGITQPEGFSWEFGALWQLSDKEKADVANAYSTSIISAHDAGLIGDKTAMQELKGLARATGLFSNITSEQIDRAEEDPPDPMDAMTGLSPGEGAAPGTPGYRDQEAAVDDYLAAHSDGRGGDRLGAVRRMDIPGLKTWLAKQWTYGAEPNGKVVVQ